MSPAEVEASMIANELRALGDRVGGRADEVLEFLESPAGRRLRRSLATGLLVSVPLVMRVPGLRRSPLGRAVELAGGAAIVVKTAELVRDWERRPVATGPATRS
jgi:hypothetical protein